MVHVRRHVTRRLAAGLLGLPCLGALACGSSGPEMAAVSGKVTYHDAPVTEGNLTYIPVDPNLGAPAIGSIGPDGSYTMQTIEPGDGVRPGQYKVAVSVVAEPADTYAVKKQQPKSKISPVYADPETSGITVTVESGKSNIIPIDLK